MHDLNVVIVINCASREINGYNSYCSFVSRCICMGVR
jgi:hypothetical protein